MAGRRLFFALHQLMFRIQGFEQCNDHQDHDKRERQSRDNDGVLDSRQATDRKQDRGDERLGDTPKNFDLVAWKQRAFGRLHAEDECGRVSGCDEERADKQNGDNRHNDAKRQLAEGRKQSLFGWESGQVDAAFLDIDGSGTERTEP